MARYRFKDLDGAAMAARKRPSRRKIPRAEYVLGRILEAKGDAAGAREHISKYLEHGQEHPRRGHDSHAHSEHREAGARAEPELEVL